MNIKFFTGTMGSGKSKKLITKFAFEKDKKIALAATLHHKTGEKGLITSRNLSQLEAIYLGKDEDEQIIKLISDLILKEDYKVFFIDEVQFLSKRVVSFLIHLSRAPKLTFYCFGLMSDFRGEYFESSKLLIDELPITNLRYIERVCETTNCFNSAEYNARVVDGKVIRDGEVFVSGKNKYVSLCKKCYFQK